MSIGTLPLSRFTVLDLCHARAGPTAVRQLADWGANVIKIEPPGEARSDVTGSRREGFDFQNLHRNKRSITLNLKAPEGLAAFKLPRAHQRPMRTSNPIERSIQQELKRRTRKIRVFPNEASLVRLASAILVEIDEQWAASQKPYVNFNNTNAD